MKNIRVFYLKNFSFLEVKFSIYLNRRVFVMWYSDTLSWTLIKFILLSIDLSQKLLDMLQNFDFRYIFTVMGGQLYYLKTRLNSLELPRSPKTPPPTHTYRTSSPSSQTCTFVVTLLGLDEEKASTFKVICGLQTYCLHIIVWTYQTCLVAPPV